jgi:hypothetical protein
MAIPKPREIAKEMIQLTSSPDVMADIAYLLYKGWTDDSISQQLELPITTIQKIRADHPETAEAHKEFLIGKINEFTCRGIDRMCKELPYMHIDKLPLALGIIIDKGQLLQGQATTRIDTSKGISQEKLIDILERMKRASTSTTKGMDSREEIREIGEGSDVHKAA